MKALKIISFFLLIVAGTTSSQNTNTKCPFQFVYSFGDGFSDIGNSVRILPSGLFLPSKRYPYGKTTPGYPTGRWSDGLIAIDYSAQALGLPNTKPYLSLGLLSTNYDGVGYGVQGSTLLSTAMLNSKNIDTPSYNTPLPAQINWFKTYLRSTCISSQKECARRLPSNSIAILEFSEIKDLGYALIQGKPMAEVASYVPLLVQALIDAIREVIKLGVTRIIVTNAAPLSCAPYILTAFPSNDPTAYGVQGCLMAVSNITRSYNAALQTDLTRLRAEFPSVTLLLADFNIATRTVINQTGTLGPNNPALRSCCGIGGKYNYDSRRFCGSLKVPVCPNPNNYVYWDGIHLTQEAYRRIIDILARPALAALNCTST